MSGEIIVPEDFDLDSALSAQSSTPEEEMRRCPECRAVNIQRKSNRPESHRERSEDWRCQTCEIHFEEPLPPESEVGA
jgi:rubredoxin